MQNGKTIVGIAIIIILLAAAYVFLIDKDVQNGAAVDLVSPEKPSQPEQFQSKMPGGDAVAPVPKRKERAAIVQQEETFFDESSLPTGLPPEDAILDPDAEGVVYDADATQVNIGEYLDPDAEEVDYDADAAPVNIGEYIDPDADPLPSISDDPVQHIGPFIDIDSDALGGSVPSGPEEAINIGDYIEPDEVR